MSSIKYYQNEPCEVLSEFENKAVIRVVVASGQVGGSWDEPPEYVEYEKELVVLKEDLYDKIIEFETEGKAIIKDAKREADKIIKEANSQKYATKREAEKELSEIKKKIEKYSSLKLMVDIYENKYDYLLCTNYSSNYSIVDYKEEVEKFKRYRDDEETYTASLSLSDSKKDSLSICYNTGRGYDTSTKTIVAVSNDIKELDETCYKIIDNDPTFEYHHYANLYSFFAKNYPEAKTNKHPNVLKALDKKEAEKRERKEKEIKEYEERLERVRKELEL